MNEHNLARIIFRYNDWCVANNRRPTLLGLAEWVRDNDTNKNVHRYQEKPDAFDESNDPKDYRITPNLSVRRKQE